MLNKSFYVKYNTQVTSLNSKVSFCSHGRTENCIILFDSLRSLNFQLFIFLFLFGVRQKCKDIVRITPSGEVWLLT